MGLVARNTVFSNSSLNVSDAQLLLWHPGEHEGDVFRDGVILTIPPAARKRFKGSGPIIFLLPVVLVGNPPNSRIEEVVRKLKFFLIGERLNALDERDPLINKLERVSPC